ncbi:MAG: putative GTP-binding protein EngB [Candidatus Parcubacteria bacterium]|jgi:GTP-binding protein
MQPSAVFLKSVVRLADLPDDDKPQIALVGRSNVGKSSLVNHLAGVKDIARVSSAPGLTQALNFFELNRAYYLVDLPGYGYASKSKERREHFLALITDYLQRARQLRLVFLVVDARVGMTDLDEKMLHFLQRAGIEFVMVVNKSDKLSRGKSLALVRALSAKNPGVTCILHSTSAKAGRGDLLAAIEKALKKAPAED